MNASHNRNKSFTSVETNLVRSLTCLALMAVLIASGKASEPSDSEWRQFRGPSGNGHAFARNLPLTWGGFLEPADWEASIPGRGWSSPIVVGSHIWLTTAETIAIPENAVIEKLQLTLTGVDDFQTHGSVTFFAIELELRSGKILRKVELMSVDHPPPIHTMNSYASPTPTSDGVNIYCHFGSLGTIAIELSSGTILWKKTFAVDDMTGSGSSPVLFGDRLIIACDGADEQFMVAVNKMTGEVIWKTNRPPIEAQEKFLRRAFSTPILVEHAGRQQLISSSAQWLVSYDPEIGAEIWRCKTASGYSVVPQPAFHDGLVFASTGFMKPELWAIRADGSGDVSQTHVVWKNTRQAPELASPIVVDNDLYFVSKMGVLSCLRASDGSQRWQQRLDGSYAASPTYADGKLYLTNQAGLTTVMKPGAAYEELAKNTMFGETLATMAIAGDAILIRTDPILYCIRKP